MTLLFRLYSLLWLSSACYFSSWGSIFTILSRKCSWKHWRPRSMKHNIWKNWRIPLKTESNTHCSSWNLISVFQGNSNFCEYRVMSFVVCFWGLGTKMSERWRVFWGCSLFDWVPCACLQWYEKSHVWKK